MTLRLPRVPTPKGFHFEGVAEHQLRQALAGEIRETIKTLIASTYVPGWQGMFYKFLDAVEPGTERDDARIPYPALGPNDRRGTKIGCVYARLGWVVKLWYDLCFAGADNAALIREYLADLRSWAAAGFEKCRLAGNPLEGYWLGTPS
jgi:hypothetical protein